MSSSDMLVYQYVGHNLENSHKSSRSFNLMNSTTRQLFN